METNSVESFSVLYISVNILVNHTLPFPVRGEEAMGMGGGVRGSGVISYITVPIILSIRLFSIQFITFIYQ